MMRMMHLLHNPTQRKAIEAALAQKGTHGDVLLAHITPVEAAMLKAMGGVGTHNPKTGLLQFYPGQQGIQPTSIANASTSPDQPQQSQPRGRRWNEHTGQWEYLGGGAIGASNSGGNNNNGGGGGTTQPPPWVPPPNPQQGPLAPLVYQAVPGDPFHGRFGPNAGLLSYIIARNQPSGSQLIG